MWGASPWLFIAIDRLGASPWEIVGQRAVWAAPCAAALAMSMGAGPETLALFRDPRRLGLLALSAAAIGTGWAVFVWAVNHGHNLDAALGYYINPLLNMASGAVLFRERIDRFGWAAIALATIGVIVQAVAVGGLPWIALVCAVTFWIYGLIRKQIAAEALSGLTVECVLMAIPGLAYLAWLSAHGHPLFGRSISLSLMVASVGPATAAPLALFSWTARRLPLSTIAFLQFISPTMGFFTGLVMGEPLSTLRVVSFVFIWAGVAAFITGAAHAQISARSRSETPPA